MRTDTNRRAVIVGLFIALSITLFGGAILTVGDLGERFTRKIAVSAVFDDVGGLQVGDNVWFSGLKVGTVRTLGFHGGPTGSAVEVGFAINRAAAEFIPADAVARVGTDGLIGNKIVVLYDGTPGGPLVADGAVLEVGASVTTDDMKDMLQRNNENLLAITADLRALTSQLASSEGSAARLIADDTLYPKLEATVSALEVASANAQQLTASLSTFAGKLNREGSLPNDLATDEELYGSLTDSIRDLRQVTEHATAVVARLDRGTADPTTPAGVVLGDPQAAADLKSVLSNLDEGSRLLSEDLEAMQHNVLLRGYFKKREREREKAAAPPAE